MPDISVVTSSQWAPATYAATPLPSAWSRHVANRFTGGWTPGLQRQIDARGGIDAWFSSQLAPSTLPDPYYDESLQYWPSNNLAPEQVAQRDADGTEPLWVAGVNYMRWSMLRRISSAHHLQEQLAFLWENHFNVPAAGDAWTPFRAHYGRAIRARALGRFSDLLKTVIVHPAMGVYLNNAQSTASALNENLGRELLELHTVGLGAGFTERDVKDSARILTGYRVDVWNSWKAEYDPSAHHVGPVRVLGFTAANDSSDGRATTMRYLEYLARHPATAHRVARKLAVRFVSDHPSDALVDRLARVYLANDTRIAPVLRALVASTEFAGSADRKTRTSDEDVIATYRVLGTKIQAPRTEKSAANWVVWQAGDLGMYPCYWPRPDGIPDDAYSWSSVSRILASFAFHYSLAGGGWIPPETRSRTFVSWLPEPRVRFDQLVDHLSRSLLGRASTARLLQACCEATGTARGAVIDAQHPIVTWMMPRLLTTFLDTPHHLGR